MDVTNLLATDNIAIGVLLVIVWKLWGRYTKTEDAKSAQAVAFTESVNLQVNVMDRALEKMEQMHRDLSE